MDCGAHSPVNEFVLGTFFRSPENRMTWKKCCLNTRDLRNKNRDALWITRNRTRNKSLWNEKFQIDVFGLALPRRRKAFDSGSSRLLTIRFKVYEEGLIVCVPRVCTLYCGQLVLIVRALSGSVLFFPQLMRGNSFVRSISLKGRLFAKIWQAILCALSPSSTHRVYGLRVICRVCSSYSQNIGRFGNRSSDGFKSKAIRAQFCLIGLNWSTRYSDNRTRTMKRLAMPRNMTIQKGERGKWKEWIDWREMQPKSEKERQTKWKIERWREREIEIERERRSKNKGKAKDEGPRQHIIFCTNLFG